MDPTSVFANRRLVAVMQHLYSVARAAAGTIGDMGVVEYAYLLALSEREGGVTLRSLDRQFDCFEDPQHFATLLIDKELVTRTRSATDRRAFAVQVTPKGKDRIALVDEAMAGVLIDGNPARSVDELEYLFGKMADLAAAMGPESRVRTMVPGAAMVALCRYHRVVAQQSAQLGMPPVHAALLCQLVGSSAARSVDELAGRLRLSPALVKLQVERLQGKRLVHSGSDLALTDQGEARVIGFMGTLSASLSADFAALGGDLVGAFAELGTYAVFLFG